MRRILKATLTLLATATALVLTACVGVGGSGSGTADADGAASAGAGAGGSATAESGDVAGELGEGLEPATGEGIPPLAEPGSSDYPNIYDGLYNPDFSLPELGGDGDDVAGFRRLSQPAPAANSSDHVTDPVTGVKLLRSTNAAQTDPPSDRLRHEYSRRQAFNADSTRFIAQNERGEWFLHDATSFQMLKPLPQLVGDAEPLWSAADPALLLFTARSGGSTWQSINVHTDEVKGVFNFAGKTPWKKASAFWTHGEGTTSANGRVLTVIASSYNESTGERKVYGIVTVDLEKQRIIGTLDAKDFPVPGAIPDHVSTSPSGGYAVVSWLAEHGGTRAYRVDFSASTQLAKSSEHSDLAFNRDGQDVYVYTDYQDGNIIAVNIRSGDRFKLAPLYPESGSSYAAHISGQAFNRPGWVVISSYGATADYGKTELTGADGPYYHRVWLQELTPRGRALSVASTQVDPQVTLPGSDAAYFLEPQATVSRDLSRIMFASNFGSSTIESYTAALPSWVTRD